jgi:6-phosphogluconolactonase/glucosamine-6-phosphate isomerase/deaminase
VTLELEILADETRARQRVGELIAERAQARPFCFALSRAPAAMLEALAAAMGSWNDVELYQVDERIGAPVGSYERNSSALLRLPRRAFGSIRSMPADEPDPEQAARSYASDLPRALDLVHLGLGVDGHTASLFPDDPVLQDRDRLVAVTREHQGFRRMTLTFPVLDAAREIVWLVTGEEKRDALARLLARDTSIPAARVASPRQLVVADEEAAS